MPEAICDIIHVHVHVQVHAHVHVDHVLPQIGERTVRQEVHGSKLFLKYNAFTCMYSM